MKIERLCKIVFMIMFGIYISLVALNNLIDFNSNYQFVKHILAMDTTFPGNSLMWHAISSPKIVFFFYCIIITFEMSTMFFAWLGCYCMLKNFYSNAELFQRSKKFAIISLLLSLITWFFMFNTIGGEWFLMWQSKQWNGIEVARSMFTVIGIIFLYLTRKDEELIKNE